ncbi:hypothetical protein GCM10007860_23170 [Chitiniphilus shinanonensis]|uniref:OmpR/PhoB-type domain-containing protein n=1 Tax=Chitiniphilus shinanonensis TaxID=553088 RepID=A0ABQ6BY66_9NEIS|nr:hypothetical protein GCM10007860_23170 [Chitiniphilus shinanonensis]
MRLFHRQSGLDIDLTAGLIQYTARAGGMPVQCWIKMSRRDGELLHYLVRQNGKLVSKELLQQQFFADRKNRAAALIYSIWQIRQYLLIADMQCDCLRTIHGYGYRFDAQLSGLEILTTPAVSATPLAEPCAG